MMSLQDLSKKYLFLGLLVLACIIGSSCAQQPVKETLKASEFNVSTSSKSKEDVYGAAAAIEDLFNRRYTNNKAVHLESVMSAIGASAGFGSQMALREELIDTGKMPETKVFVVVGTKDGQKYYYGDRINRLLFEAPKGTNTVWEIVSGGAEYAGAKEIPDYKEIITYNAKTLGTPAFGIPRLPQGHEPKEAPIEVLRNIWPEVRAILAKYHIESRSLGWVCAVAAQKVVIQKQDKIDPSLAAKIFAEAAFPMSKIDPATVLTH